MSKELELREDDETLDQTTLTQRRNEEVQKVLDWMHAVCQGRYEENGYTDGTLREGFGYVFIFVLWLASVDLPLVSEGYDIMIPSLIEVTLDHIRDKPKADTVNTWVMLATAQHMDLREPSPYSRNIPA